MLDIFAPRSTDIKVSKLMKHPSLFKRGIQEGAMLAGRSIQRRATTMLGTGTRTGRKYSGLPNRSSAPGEYPRSQSGRS